MIDNNALIRGEVLCPENLEFYAMNGFLIASDFFSPDEISALKTETVEIFRGGRGHIEGLLDVGENQTDESVLKKYVAIHFPHKVSPLIYSTLFHKKVVGVLTGIIGSNVKCMQSMLFVKGPGKAGQSWHQDEFYIPTRDKSLTGVWIALEDATIDNGCLWIIPGRPSFIMRRVANENPAFADVDTVDTSSYPPEQMIPVEVKKGSVIFFNGYTLHSSLNNRTADGFRLALVNHYMSADSMLPWDQDGKLQPTEDLRDTVLVAGVDPYGWKGQQDVNKPYLRPEVLNIKKS